jgi:hypothetical protein
MKSTVLMKIPAWGLIVAALLLAACDADEFLTKPPLDELTDENYWSSENNVRTFAYGFYTDHFEGYGTGYFSWGGSFWGDGINDDFAKFVPDQYPTTVPNSSGEWSFDNIRRANLMIDRVSEVPMDEEAVDHWTGIARFFRAMEYADKVNTFGDFPWYGEVIDETNTEQLFRPRSPRTQVMDSVLADFTFAYENVRATDPLTGPEGLVVTRDVVLAFMSRIFLFEGTYIKYHDIDPGKATEYLEAAQWAANQLIDAGNYRLHDNYRTLFNALSLSGNPEVILYRAYDSGEITHSLHTYVNVEAQNGITKSAIDAYLAEDGLPVSVSPLYDGDRSIDEVMTNRDPRLPASIVDELRLTGLRSDYSTTGYSSFKFFNESIANSPEGGNSNFNPTDAVEVRYAEVLLNYAEATAERGALTQADLDKSINLLRDRVGMPHLQIVGGEPAVNGVVYDDPERDPDVPPLLWEIRRERRIELLMEGFRHDDLRRWRKLEYADTPDSDANRGAWIDESEWPDALSVTIEDGATEGYIVPAPSLAAQRVLTDPRVYLAPVPLDQIALYSDQGVDLAQNPGW